MKIAYIGNSYFTSGRLGSGRNLETVLENMAASVGEELEVDMNWQLSQRLHWEDTDGLNAQDQLNSGDYDIALFYPHGWNLIGRVHEDVRLGETQEEGLAEFNTYVDLLAGLADENNVDIVIPGMWAFDTHVTDQANDLVAALSHVEMRETAFRLDASYTASGLAFVEARRLLTENAGDEGQTADALLTRDAVHLGAHGTYLVAVVHYHAFFGVMAPTPDVYRHPDLTLEEAQFYYDIAARNIEAFSFTPGQGNANDGSRLDLSAAAIEVEAEDMDAIGMSVENGIYANGGQYMEVENQSGSLQTVFTGESGLYRVSVMIQDDERATAGLDILVNGQIVKEFDLNRPWDPDGNDVNFGVLRTYDVQLNANDVVRLDVTSDGVDIGRVDKLVFEKLKFADVVGASSSISGQLAYAGEPDMPPALDTYSVILFNVTEGTITDAAVAADGSYAFSDLNAGTYQVRFPPKEGVSFIEDEDVATYGIESDVTGGWANGVGFTRTFVVGPNEDVTDVDAGLQFGDAPLGNSVSGQLAYAGTPDGAPDLSGFTVALFHFDERVLTQKLVNADGTYSFDNIAAGTYQVRFQPVEGVEFLNVGEAATAGVESDITGGWANGVGFTSQFTVADGEQVTNIDAGLKFGDLPEADLASVSGQLAYAGTPTDAPDMSDFAVVLFNVDNGAIASTDVAADGTYTFGDLAAGNYQVRFRPVDGVDYLDVAAAAVHGAQSDITGGWGNGVAFTSTFAVADGEDVAGIDAAMQFGDLEMPTLGSVSGRMNYAGFGPADAPDGGLSDPEQKFSYEFWELNGANYNNLADAGFVGAFNTNTLTGSGLVDTINVDRLADAHGINRDTFAVKLTTTLTVDTAGSHFFELGGDDGVKLFIDGVEVINHDGLHAHTTRTATVELSAGQHTVEAIHFENYGGESLAVKLRSSDTNNVLIDLEDADVKQSTSDVPANAIAYEDFDVVLFDFDTRSISQTDVAQDGTFQFENVAEGSYQVRFQPGAGIGYELSDATFKGEDTVAEPFDDVTSDVTGQWANGVSFTDVFDVANGEDVSGINAALLLI